MNLDRPSRLDHICWFSRVRFCVRATVYQIDVHRMDLLPDLNPLVSRERGLQFVLLRPSSLASHTSEVPSDCEVNGSSLLSV